MWMPVSERSRENSSSCLASDHLSGSRPSKRIRQADGAPMEGEAVQTRADGLGKWLWKSISIM